MALTVPTVFTATDKFSATIGKMQGNLQNFTDNAQRGFKKFSPVLGDVAKDMLSAFSVVAVAEKVGELFKSSFESAERYENAVVSLSAASGLTGEALENMETKIKAVALATQKGDSETAEAFKTVGSLNPALYQNADAMGQVTKAAITLGQATKTDLSASATDLTQIMRAFKAPAEDANRVINTLVATTNKGGITYTELSAAIKGVGETARNANMTFEQTSAAIATINKSTNSGAGSGADLQKVILKLEKAHIGYKNGIFSLDEAIDQINHRTDKMKGKQKDAYLSTLGLRGASIDAARALLNNKGSYDALTKGVSNTNAAQEKSEAMMNTLSGAIERLKSAWDRMINNSDKAGTALNTIKNILKFVTKHLDLFMKIMLMAAVVVGGYYAVILILNSAIWLLEAAATAVTVAQWLWNAAMLANPIGLIIVGIIALAAFIDLIIQKWDSWGSTVVFFLGPIGMLISLFKTMYDSWTKITDAFKSQGILSGLKAIGQVILDSILTPLQKVFGLLLKIPGVGLVADASIKAIQSLRNATGAGQQTDANGNAIPNPVVDNRANQHQAQIEKSEQVNSANVNLNIGNNSGFPMSVSNPQGVQIKTTSTMPYQTGYRN